LDESGPEDMDEKDNNNNNNNSSSIEAADSAAATTKNSTVNPSEQQISNTGNTSATQPNNNKNSENSSPIATITPENIVAHPNDKVVLDGSQSSDPDGDIITYSWSQSDGPNVDIAGADTATPTITIPDLNDGDKATINLVVSDGQRESNRASVVIDIQRIEEIEGSEEQRNLALNDVTEGTRWSDAGCDGNAIINCLTDSSDSTFVSSDRPSHSSSSSSSNLLFSFQNLDEAAGGGNNDGDSSSGSGGGSSTTSSTTDNIIESVTAQVTAKGIANPGFISFSVGKPNNQEQHITPSLSVRPEAFGDYSFTWKNDPVTGAPWTADSLNSLVVGLSHSAGQGSIEISEFKLIVTANASEEDEEEPTPSPESSSSESRSSAHSVDSGGENEEEPTPSPESGDASAPEDSEVSNARDNIADDDESIEDGTQDESGVTNDDGGSDN